MKFEDLFYEISYREFNCSISEMIGHDYLLLTAGNEESYNTMTIGWGAMGFIWQRPVFYVPVRPQRYTYEFMEKNSCFTVSYFGDEYREALSICGSKSGRDCDKVKLAGLTPLRTPFASVAFSEASVIFECRKIYFEDMNPENILDESILRNYPAKDFHRIYTGQIEKIWKRKIE
jgi:flavin reductase (DIM6/NTAB) family NADH-FMN oxidoreductase RutF